MGQYLCKQQKIRRAKVQQGQALFTNKNVYLTAGTEVSRDLFIYELEMHKLTVRTKELEVRTAQQSVLNPQLNYMKSPLDS